MRSPARPPQPHPLEVQDSTPDAVAPSPSSSGTAGLPAPAASAPSALASSSASAPASSSTLASSSAPAGSSASAPDPSAPADPPTAAPVQLAFRRRELALVASSLITQLMIVLDMTIIAVALPRMQEDLGLSTSQRPWVVTAYTLAYGGLVLLGGRLVTALGLRRAYRIGQIGFATASLVAGLAPAFPLLVTARAVQGAFAALLSPASLVLLSTTFPSGPRRRQVFALFGATGGLGAAAGLLIGGALTDWLSWRWSLYVNVPIAAAGFVIGLRSLPAPGRRHEQSAWDLPGLALGCTACFAVVFGLDRAEQTSWTSTSTLLWLGAAVVLAILFVVREHLAEAPALPLWITSAPGRAASYAAVATFGAAQMGGAVYLTYYLQNHFGYSPLRTGVAFLPMIAALVPSAPLAGRLLVPYLGVRGTLPLGVGVEALAFVVLAQVGPDSGYAQVAVPGLVLMGIGAGLIMPVAFSAGTRGIPQRHSGLASAVLTITQQIGGSFGVALLATYATRHVQDYVTTHTEAVRAQATQALVQAQALPDSPAGKEIIARFTADLSDRAQIDAYAGGFLLMACLLAAVTALLVLGALTVRRVRSR